MKAFRINQWGQPGALEDIPQPVPANDEVLVRVHASSINPVDVMSVAGYLQAMQQVPLTPGTDFAGEVVSTGANVTHVKAGDAVYGMIPIRGGAFAEYATPKGHELALKPQSLDYEQAAAVPLASLAAWQTLIDFAKVQDGERVLILGAAGNVGSVAVQLAKQNGAYVIACDLAGRENFLLELGADELIDAGTQKFEEQVKDIDIVLNYASADLLERAYSVIKSGGRYATTFGQPDPVEAELHGIRSFGVFTQPTVEHLTRLANMIDANKLKVFVQNTFPLDATQAALNYRLPAGQAGKVVLTVS